MYRRTAPALAALLLLGGCGSDDSSSADTQAANPPKAATTTKPQTTTVPRLCASNADGKITTLNRKTDRGVITAKRVGHVSFRPSKDILVPTLKKGDAVYFTYSKVNGKGIAKCLLPTTR